MWSACLRLVRRVPVAARSFALACASLTPWPGWAQPAPLTVCADPDPPPSFYWVRDAQGQRTGELAGFALQTVQAAFQRAGLAVAFIGTLPWARCMKEVETGAVDFALGAYHDEDRARRFVYSRPYRTLTPSVFFRRSRPIVVNGTADLGRYQGCGMIGASYAHYDLRAVDLDLGVNTYAQLVQKLAAGRCDYFVEEFEVIDNHRRAGRDLLAGTDIVTAPVPGARAPGQHLIAARDGKAAALMPAIDKALGEVIRSGQAAAFWRQHAGNAPYRP